MLGNSPHAENVECTFLYCLPKYRTLFLHLAYCSKMYWSLRSVTHNKSMFFYTSIMLLCYYAITLLCYYAIMLLRYYDIMLLYYAITLLCYYAITLLCYCYYVIMLLCYYAITLLCYYAIMLLCYYAIMLLCYYAMKLNRAHVLLLRFQLKTKRTKMKYYIYISLNCIPYLRN